MQQTLLMEPHITVADRIARLRVILPHIWSRESSGFPDEWTPENPSCGQCHPTTRLVQALCDGDIIYQTLEFFSLPPGVPRFWTHCVNEIAGVRYDLSDGQLKDEIFRIDRERVLTEVDKRQLNDWPRVPR